MPAELATTLTVTEADRLLQAEALVRAFCGWHIAPSRDDEATVIPSGSGRIFLRSLLVTDVATVTQNSDPLTVDEDFTWESNGIISRATGYWSVDPVTVEFSHGYDEPPAEVTAIVQAIAQRAVSNPGSLVRTQDGPFSDTFSQTGFNQSLPMALLDAEKEVLRPYRLPSIA